MKLNLTKSRDDKLLQDLLDKKLRVIVVFEDDYLNHIARIAYKDIRQDNYTYRIGEYNIYKGEEWGFCDFCKRHDCYFIVPNETIESGSSGTPNDLKKAADKYIYKAADTPGDNWTTDDIRNAYIAGDKLHEANTPLPEDTVLFNKGVEEGKRLMMEEAVECELYYDGDFLAIDLNMAELGYSERDKVRVIVLPNTDEK